MAWSRTGPIESEAFAVANSMFLLLPRAWLLSFEAGMNLLL
jgi:hypothetical protein